MSILGEKLQAIGPNFSGLSHSVVFGRQPNLGG